MIGPDAMIFIFWMLSFKPPFFTLLFQFHQEALHFFFSFYHKDGVICISDVTGITQWISSIKSLSRGQSHRLPDLWYLMPGVVWRNGFQDELGSRSPAGGLAISMVWMTDRGQGASDLRPSTRSYWNSHRWGNGMRREEGKCTGCCEIRLLSCWRGRGYEQLQGSSNQMMNAQQRNNKMLRLLAIH